MILITLYLALINIIPIALVALVIYFLKFNFFIQFIGICLSPLIYLLGYVFTAGLLAHNHISSIINGKFPRDLKNPIYFGRRLYGLCWTSVYYHKPIYFLVLTIPLLRRLTFRLFGYRGSPNITLYPDTWIRDLPLLDISEGAYIANRATLGTNMPMINGTIIVESIRIGKGSLIGHFGVVGAGSQIGDRSEIGAGAGVGMKVRIGNNVSIGPAAVVNHGAVIGDKAIIGTMSYIGRKVVVGPGLTIPPGTVIPDRLEISTTEEIEKLVSARTTNFD